MGLHPLHLSSVKRKKANLSHKIGTMANHQPVLLTRNSKDWFQRQSNFKWTLQKPVMKQILYQRISLECCPSKIKVIFTANKGKENITNSQWEFKVKTRGKTRVTRTRLALVLHLRKWREFSGPIIPRRKRDTRYYISIAFLFVVNGDENSRHLYSRSSPFNSHEWPRQNFSLQYQ